MTSCAICGKRLPSPTTGRPPTYCSVAHRRRAEAERAALPAMKANLEHLQEMARLYPRDLMGWRRLAREVAADVARIEARQ